MSERIAMNHFPTYIIGDMNARHPLLWGNTVNRVGRKLSSLVQQGKLMHLGPDFPTFVTHNSATSPDIVLCNRRCHHNILIERGPLTASDHLPIIITVDTGIIKVPISPKLQIYKTDWNSFREEIGQYNQYMPTSPSLEEIDKTVKDWTETIQNALKKYCPTAQTKSI